MLFEDLPMLNIWEEYETHTMRLDYFRQIEALNCALDELKSEKGDEYLRVIYDGDNFADRDMNESSSREKYISIMKDKFRNKKLLFIEPKQSNQRILMQQGLFLFPYILDKTQLADVIEINSFVIKIDKKLRDEMNKYLNAIGINAYRLMPDLSSICEAVERKIKGI